MFELGGIVQQNYVAHFYENVALLKKVLNDLFYLLWIRIMFELGGIVQQNYVAHFSENVALLKKLLNCDIYQLCFFDF